jgi:hypothetical protein
MPVDANGGNCRDADGVNMNDIASIVQSKGAANVASIGLLSDDWNINLDSSSLFVQWQSDSVDAQIGTFDGYALSVFRGFTRVPSVNSCTALPYLGYPPPVDYGLGYVSSLDAGPSLSIQGPLGTMPVAKNANGNGYDAIVGGSATTDLVGLDGIAPFYWTSTANGDGTYNPTAIASGNYTVTAPGGAGLGAFSGTIDIPAAAASFSWNASAYNVAAAPQVPRTGLQFSWTGGDPAGFVDITLYASTVENSYPSLKTPEPAIAIECIAPVNAGSFKVPEYVMQAMPPATNSGSFVSGVVLVGQSSAVTKITPVPTGLDAAYMYYRLISGYTVQWQ